MKTNTAIDNKNKKRKSEGLSGLAHLYRQPPEVQPFVLTHFVTIRHTLEEKIFCHILRPKSIFHILTHKTIPIFLSYYFRAPQQQYCHPKGVRAPQSRSADLDVRKEAIEKSIRHCNSPDTPHPQ